MYARKPEVASGTSVPEARRTTHEPRRCRVLFRPRELRVVLHLPVADDHVRLVGEDRLDEPDDVLAAVLVVGVRVDDDVGAELGRGVDPGLEGEREPLVGVEADDVVDAVLAGDAGGAVRRAVVDDQPLDPVEAGHVAREIGQRRRQHLRFVQARNLDDQLHGCTPIRLIRWHTYDLRSWKRPQTTGSPFYTSSRRAVAAATSSPTSWGNWTLTATRGSCTTSGKWGLQDRGRCGCGRTVPECELWSRVVASPHLGRCGSGNRGDLAGGGPRLASGAAPPAPEAGRAGELGGPRPLLPCAGRALPCGCRGIGREGGHRRLQVAVGPGRSRARAGGEAGGRAPRP